MKKFLFLFGLILITNGSYGLLYSGPGGFGTGAAFQRPPVEGIVIPAMQYQFPQKYYINDLDTAYNYKSLEKSCKCSDSFYILIMIGIFVVIYVSIKRK